MHVDSTRQSSCAQACRARSRALLRRIETCNVLSPSGSRGRLGGHCDIHADTARVRPGPSPSPPKTAQHETAAPSKLTPYTPYNTPPAPAPAPFLLPRPVRDERPPDEEARQEVNRNISDIVRSNDLQVSQSSVTSSPTKVAIRCANKRKAGGSALIQIWSVGAGYSLTHNVCLRICLYIYVPMYQALAGKARALIHISFT